MEEQLDRAAAVVTEVLADRLRGLYLFGSAVLGGLRPTSDLDLLAVTRRPTTVEERRRLVEGFLALSRRPRHLELTVVAESEVRPWRYPPTMDLQYGDWLGAALRRGEIAPPAPNPDLAVLLTMARRNGRALSGPPPAEALGPVPHGDVLRSGLDAIDGLLRGLDDDTRNVLLTLARIWCTAETAGIRSKDDAAEWALARVPLRHRPVLERARDAYRRGDYGVWDDLDAAACAAHLATAIRGSSRRRGGASPR